MSVHCENCGTTTPSAELQARSAQFFLNNQLGKTTGNLNICLNCARYFDDRTSATEAVLSSTDEHRVVIAGPGCGKTYLFREAVKRMPPDSRVLILTFINNLAADLTNELQDIGRDDIDLKVRTLHAFEAAEFHRLHPGWEYFPGLPSLVEDDARILGQEHLADDVRDSFANLEDTDARSFYLDRAAYYRAAGYDDAGFRVQSFYQEDSGKRPSYDLVVVDEFQDFNRLEAKFLQVLGDGGQMLVAGDDDQSIYGFKHADPTLLQHLHSSADSDYVSFELPHSGRCPHVVVEAVNAAIAKATEHGLLAGRVNKSFASYYPDKFLDDRNHPLIHRANCTNFEKVSWEYVLSEIRQISAGIDRSGLSTSGEPEFLIIGAPQRPIELEKISSFLQDQLDPEDFEVESYVRSDETTGPAIEQGYRLIQDHPDSNLGWRIVLFNDSSGCDMTSILEQTQIGRPLRSLLPREFVERHEEAATNPETNEETKANVVVETEMLEASDPKIRVKITTHLGAKGLSASHVFVVGLVDGVTPIDAAHITDDEFRQFLVALTRTRKSLHLITHKVFARGRGLVDRSSRLLSFIPPSLITEKDHKADDFK